jgi:hypothetical protein
MAQEEAGENTAAASEMEEERRQEHSEHSDEAIEMRRPRTS